MTEESKQDSIAEHLWRHVLTTGELEKLGFHRQLFRLLPGDPRCKNCFAPFQGVAGRLIWLLYRKRPSNYNSQLCNACEEFARQYPGGAEIELTLLFADVRGSTTLAEQMSPTEFSRLINRFYKASTKVLSRSDAMIDKIIGDQVSGMFVPGFAGQEHASRAVEAARELLQVTGHGDKGGPWIPLGASVHTGTAFVGSVGSAEGTVDITVLGDTPNTAARLASQARVGEILISEAAVSSTGSDLDHLERRRLELKGKAEGVSVRVLTADA